MFHVILTRSRSGTRAVDRLESNRRVQQACAASGAALTNVIDARRFFITASDGKHVQVYDPPAGSAKGKRTESILDTTFPVASLPIAEFLHALADTMRCASLTSGPRALTAPELDLQPPRSADPITAQDLLDYLEAYCAVPSAQDRRMPALDSKSSRE